MPRPKCATCGKETARTVTTSGKGRYQCINRECPEYLMTFYIREGSDMAEPKLQVDRRIDRIETALLLLAELMKPLGISESDYEKIENILNGSATTSETRPGETE